MNMPSNRTTDLARVLTGSPFTWGEVTATHHVGRYTIIEYIDSGDEIFFHLYVDGQSTSNSFESLESALIGAVAYGKMEHNEARWMAIAANKLMGL